MNSVRAISTLMVVFLIPALCFAVGFQTPVGYPVNGYQTGLVAADFNGDGILDLATANIVGTTGLGVTVSTLLGNGDGTFQSQMTTRLFQNAGNTSSPFLAAGDLNQDGLADLVITFEADVDVLLSNGDGTFQPPVKYSAAAGSRQLAINDFDRDGKLDVLEVADSNAIQFFRGNGDGTLQPFLSTPISQPGNGLAVADFNQDGILDLAVSGPKIVTLIGNGDGTFVARFALPVTNADLAHLAAGDLNGDGVPDLIATTPSFVVTLNDGSGRFEPVSRQAFGTGAFGIAIADFNRDGFGDAAVGVQSQQLYLLLNEGNATFNPLIKFDTGAGTGFVVTADFNNDGFPDVAMAGRGPVQTAQITVSLNTGGANSNRRPQ